MIETSRLIIRAYTQDDFEELYEILSDEETMQHYPAPFDKERTKRWIDWNLANYQRDGFGLWAIILKETGEFIGDCGVTMQTIDGDYVPEIGYHINKNYWKQGYAKEAASAVRDWFFVHTHYDTIYSYMKYTNVASYQTALAIGMTKIKEYSDPINTVSSVYAISRSQWQKLINTND
ncbi:GNAT family N-acetyltransferase [Vagococcus zengguangii]|uniref:GNAT family N-acetyltransferase n=1 Tax=Vagococcus zengguangii TaxID=2571750 RepID=UPI001AEFB2ED|nr:GNAT family N-acetyltransferase [Vagococcus zengguangii]